MAISKRLRFEILRRDNHACRYCGRSAPEVVLHVDHVKPQALGGTDDPSNLATSCGDCNSGKTSTAPDQSVVEDVNKDAERWSAAMAQAAEEMRLINDGRSDLYMEIQNTFPSYFHRRIPNDFCETIDRFLNAGLPFEVMKDMAQIAAYKPAVYDRWAYFCGCCWTKVREIQERAAEILASEDGADG